MTYLAGDLHAAASPGILKEGGVGGGGAVHTRHSPKRPVADVLARLAPVEVIHNLLAGARPQSGDGGREMKRRRGEAGQQVVQEN